MKINEIIERDISDSEKVVAIAEIVSKARKNYGNADIEISTIGINTTDGIVDMEYLGSGDKVAVAHREFKNCVLQAIEHCKCTEGSILDKEIESLIATNPVLVNLLKESESSYI